VSRSGQSPERRRKTRSLGLYAGTDPGGVCPETVVGTVPVRGQSLLFCAAASITSMSEATQQPLEQQLEEIGTQLAWVRDYL